MCGIAGYYGVGDREVLERMTQSLEHRGPDAKGVYVTGKVGLGHRRLSILDVSDRGAQPMQLSESRVVLSYNGEVFNFKELRAQHLADEKFVGDSDTEVIVRLYKKFGVESFSMLRGMFAFALYDTMLDKLFLVRDQLGKKPLYVAQAQSGTLMFASELKALRQHPECPTELDVDAISAYLCFEYIPTPKTIYKGVHKLAPHTYAVYDGNELREFPLQQSRVDISDDPQQQFADLIESSVRQRLVADVPVGVFLSGGLDSSAVAYYAQKNTAQPIQTFSVGFVDATFDESDDASAVAQHLGTDHHAIQLELSDMLDMVKDLPDLLDEPMADSSIVPTALVSRFAARSVKVCLSGDGADEMFHGYSTFRAERLARQYRRIPSGLTYPARKLIELMPVSHQYMSLDFKLKRFMQGANSSIEEQHMRWLAAFAPEEIRGISGSALRSEVVAEQLKRWHGDSTTALECMQTEYNQGYLIDDILVKIDRASMRYGLEVRSPFLDESLWGFAGQLDSSWKVKDGTQKYIVKQAVRSHLPKRVFNKSKQGFNIPVGRLINQELRDEFSSMLLDGPLMGTGLFDRGSVETLLTEHRENRRDNRKQIWTLYVLACWLDRWQ